MSRQPRRILVIDDDEELGQLICAYINDRFTIETIWIGDLDDAFEVAQYTPVALMLCDIMLPHRKEHRFWRLTASFHMMRIAPLIFMSALDRSFAEELSPHVGFLAKPFDLAVIDQVIRAWCHSGLLV